MIAASHTDSAEALNARLKSLEARLANFERDQKLGAQHTARAEAIRRRRQEIEAEIDAAIARGDHWAMVREEFARDFAGLSDELDDLMAGAGAEA